MKSLIRYSVIGYVFWGIIGLALSGCDSEDNPVEGENNTTYTVRVSSRYFSKEGVSYNWFSESGFYWAVTSKGQPYNSARWYAPFTEEGEYWVSVYIPGASGKTRKATYTIAAEGTTFTKLINQESYNNAWVSLGRYYFYANGSEYVGLHNDTGENGYKMVFASVMWERDESD